jgi:sulfite dehydrogenase (cytochrome) subunit A
MQRRQFLGWAAGATAAALGTAGRTEERSITMPFANGVRPLVQYPQKRALIRLTTRPPGLETPFEVFDEGVLTPNDAFFVRYHHANLPLTIDPDTHRLQVGGALEKPLQLSLNDLKTGFDTVEIVAVNQCSGNGRAFFEPRVAGGQLGHGAMGNARWRGVRLKDVLDRAGVQAGAKEVMFQGADSPVVPATPAFIKSLSIDHARDGEVMIATAMNGEDLPFLNGYPLRLVVPGYYGTYWIKHLSQVTVLDAPFEGFWMKKSYRLPDNDCACIEPGTTPASTRPIGRYNVRSFITNLKDGQQVAAGKTIEVRGIAFDGGHGIADVQLSIDRGQGWSGAKLGEDLGKYSFRQWSLGLSLPAGTHELLVRAVNRDGQSQPMKALWNPAGYMRNIVEKVRVQAA